MNNESSTPALNDAVVISTVFSCDDDASEDARSNAWAEYCRKNRIAKRVELLDDLLRSMDMVLLLQIAALYYMDCSFLQFFLRYLVQIACVTPVTSAQDATFRPIMAANTICFLLHLVRDRPEAGEISRGYLHGGILIDFIGQKSPISKWTLVWYDVFITLFQVVMIAFGVERGKLADRMPAAANAEAETDQDLDAEERGVRTSVDEASVTDDDDEDGIELQTFTKTRHDDNDNEAQDDGARQQLLSATAESTTDTNSHPYDTFMTGQSIISEAYIVDFVQESWRRYQTGLSSAGTSTTTSGSPFALPLLASRLRARLNAGDGE